jgi:membrane protein YdbS with pleckstrin-like domain
MLLLSDNHAVPFHSSACDNDVFHLVIPAVGVAGRWAVVPLGNWKYPVSLTIVFFNVAIFTIQILPKYYRYTLQHILM